MLKKIKNKKNSVQTYLFSVRKGFTLIETLLYVSMISIMLLVLSAFLFSILQAKTKFQTISEVDQTGIQIIQLISQTLRNSKKINTPAIGISNDVLSVDVADVTKNPVVFSLSGTKFYIKEGVDANTPLNSQRVMISDLSFLNASSINTPGIINFKFTVTHVNNSGRNEYEYAKTFHGSASLRYN